MEKKIRYTARDFEAVKKELIDFSKKYYPELSDNWNDSSVGSWLIDMAASVADNLNYHIDRVYQETNINSANSKSSVLNAARLNGVKVPGPKASICEIELSCHLPLSSEQISLPNWNVAPLVKRGSVVGNAEYSFELLEDVNFGEQFNSDGYSNRTYSPRRDNNGVITAYTVTKTAIVSSGRSRIFKKVINEDELKPFMEIVIPEKNVMNVESIIFKEVTNYGQEPQSFEYYIDAEEYKIIGEDIVTYRYFEVESLSDQYRFANVISGSGDTSTIKVYDPTVCVVYEDYTETSNEVPTKTTRYYKGAWKAITQKFITEYTDNGYLKVIFGGATEDCVKSEDGSTYSKYIVGNIVNNPMMGLLPKAGWTMFILYKTGGGASTNVGPQAINSIINLNAIFPNAVTVDDCKHKNTIINSFTVTNKIPSMGGKDAPSVEEIKNLIKYNIGSQHRCVTLKDYKACLMGIHPRYGCPFRCNVVEDNNKVSIAMLNVNSKHQLTSMLPSIMIDNIKEYLSHYKMLTDYIELRSGRIYNIGFGIDVFVDKNYTTADVISKLINTVKEYMKIDNHDMGEDIFLGDLEREINNVDGVIGLIGLSAFAISNGGYSSDECPLPFKDQTTVCGVNNGFAYNRPSGASVNEIDLDVLDHVLYSDVDSQFEIKNPDIDIQVRVKLR